MTQEPKNDIYTLREERGGVRNRGHWEVVKQRTNEKKSYPWNIKTTNDRHHVPYNDSPDNFPTVPFPVGAVNKKIPWRTRFDRFGI